ncbi:MAG: pyrroline-5-carboxylate reductase [Gammaproteobacteria bacterium]|nr:pyrroline-5-carboxylate reductase [Gammaproteobacteria bacterium]
MNTNLKICFIGAGNMARSLIGGLLNDHYPAAKLCAADPDEGQRQQLNAALGIATHANNSDACTDADIIVLAVKPQIMAGACQALAPVIADARPLIISIAAGIQTTSLKNWLGDSQAIVRTMPNTPSLVGSGAAALFASKAVNDEQRQQAESILRAVGLTLWLKDEADMDAVTALSGSGPAYFFLLMELMQKIGEEMGLSREAARLLTLQTGFGATKMALESELDCAELRRRVTSPGGTTEQAINKLLDGNIDNLIDEALNAARERAKELATLLGKS